MQIVPIKGRRVFIDGVKQDGIRSATITFTPKDMPILTLEIAAVDIQVTADGSIMAKTRLDADKVKP